VQLVSLRRQHHQSPRQKRFDVVGLKSQVQQRHAFAGGGEQLAFFGVAQRPQTQRIAQHNHLAQCIEKDDVVRPIETPSQIAKHVDQIGLMIARQFAADFMHDDFGIVFACQVVVAVGQQIGLQFAIIRQLAVETKAEPLVLLQMMPLERLGVIPIVFAASGIAHMADGRPAGALFHQAFVFPGMAHAENFAHVSHIFVGEQQLLAIGVVRGNAGRKLPAVLDIQQHPGH
jgi:hypothetical protein